MVRVIRLWRKGYKGSKNIFLGFIFKQGSSTTCCNQQGHLPWVFFLYHVPIFFLIRECVLHSLFDELLSITFFSYFFFSFFFFVSFFFYFSIFFLFLFFIFFSFLEKLSMYSLSDVYVLLGFQICWWYSFLDELEALTYKLFLNFFYQNLILNFRLLTILIWGIWKKYIFFLAQRGYKGFTKFVLDIETWPYIILNHDCLIFKEFNNGTKLMTSDTCIFLFFFIVLSFA